MKPKPAWLTDGPADGPCLALAHGAGAPMDSAFMEAFADGLAGEGVRVVRFEFPYMAKRREDGKKRGPDGLEKLKTAWREVIVELPRPLLIGGKSMGGRIASLLADEVEADGLVCLGYPFHPAGKPEKLRVEHLAELRTPALFVQGERDALGSRSEVEGYSLSDAIGLAWLPDGDHSFKPRKASGVAEAENWQAGVAAVAGFVWRVDGGA